MAELLAQKRETFGKSVKSLRTQGLIPAELYGRGIENMHLSVPEKEFNKVFKEAGEHTIVQIKMGSETRPVIIHDIDEDPLTGRVRHVDFHQVRMDEKITAMIPLTFVGESPVVKEKGGVLVKSLHEIELEALPTDLPHEIEVDISSLDAVGKSISVKDLAVPSAVKLLVDPETVITSITELAPEEVAETPAPSVEEVAVEAEEKVEERRKEREGEQKEAPPESAQPKE